MLIKFEQVCVLVSEPLGEGSGRNWSLALQTTINIFTDCESEKEVDNQQVIDNHQMINSQSRILKAPAADFKAIIS